MMEQRGQRESPAARSKRTAGVTGRASAATPREAPPAVSPLDRLYRDHYRFVRRSLLRMGVRSDGLDDAIQEVFLVVARGLDSFRGEASLRTWVFSVALRVAQGMKRDCARNVRRAQRLLDRQEGLSPVTDPHSRSDAARLVHELLDELDDHKRAVFVMAELEGMSAPEIACALRLKVPTVYSRLRLARQALAAALVRRGLQGQGTRAWAA